MKEKAAARELDLERKHQEDLQRIQNFRLMDDDFMSKVFEDPSCAQLLLQIILERRDLRVQNVQSQYDLKNLQGRSVRLDILAVDQANRAYNIEVQRSDSGAAVKRARYNSSLLDANLTMKGDSYEQLNETYVIFITEHDVLGDGLPIYHIDRIIRESGKAFGDETHIIYVNAQIQNETALGHLMHDFVCSSAEKMYYATLAERVRYFKEEQKGVVTMCKALEEMRKNERIEVAQRMLLSGKLGYEEIASYTDLTVEEVKALDQQKSA